MPSFATLTTDVRTPVDPSAAGQPALTGSTVTGSGCSSPSATASARV